MSDPRLDPGLLIPSPRLLCPTYCAYLVMGRLRKRQTIICIQKILIKANNVLVPFLVWGGFTQTPAGCPTIQLNSDPIYLKIVSYSTG